MHSDITGIQPLMILMGYIETRQTPAYELHSVQHAATRAALIAMSSGFGLCNAHTSAIMQSGTSGKT